MKYSLELRAQRAALGEQANKIVELVGTEKRSMNGEEKTKFEEIHADITKMKDTIDAMERQEAMNAELASVVETKASRQINHSTMEIEDKIDAHQRAFYKYVIKGEGRLNDAERQLLETRATGEAGISGYSVSDGFNIQIFKQLKSFSAVEKAPIRKITTKTGNNYPMLLSDDTTNVGALLSENTQTTSVGDPTYTQITLGAYMFTSTPMQVSMQSEQDIDELEKDITENAGIRIGRARGNYFTNGTGTNQPQGLLTAAIANATANTALKVVAANGASLVKTWAYNNIIDLEHAVDPAYRELTDGTGKKLCGFMMHDDTIRLTKEIVDTLGRPIWKAGLGDAAPDTIDGFPYYANQFMPQMSANSGGAKSTVLFGYFPAFVVRDVESALFLRLNERYADFAQIGYIAFVRSDSKLLNTNAFSVFYNATS
jgi:HK97 family phage major capsid protein